MKYHAVGKGGSHTMQMGTLPCAFDSPNWESGTQATCKSAVAQM